MMPKYEFVIAVRDNYTHPAGIREGDIMSVLVGEKIGRKELDGWLIVPVNVPSGWSVHDLWRKFKVPLYEGGLVENIDFRHINYEKDGVNQVQYPANLYVWHIKDSKVIPRPAFLSKYRYKISFAKISAAISDVDFNKIRDKFCIYQPFLKESRIVNMAYLTSNKGHYFVQDFSGDKVLVKTHQDKDSRSNSVPIETKYTIHTSTAITIGKEDEVVLTWDAVTDLIQDKYDNLWVYP